MDREGGGMVDGNGGIGRWDSEMVERVTARLLGVGKAVM